MTRGRTVPDTVNRRCASTNLRGRKRAKPSAGGGTLQETSTWMTLATPLGTRRSGREDGDVVLNSIRQYWKQLSSNERQQILFLDDPELVKQLYKLNLSLLCVGLMQRHLKTSVHRRVSGTAIADTKVVAVPASVGTKGVTSTDAAAGTEQTATPPPVVRALPNTCTEKTYELLEAMEFMDIGTGMRPSSCAIDSLVTSLLTLACV